jgi:putative copper resistance protein D
MKLEVHSHDDGTNLVVNVLTPLVKISQLVSAITLIGLLIAIAFFIREEHGKLTKEALRVRTLARVAASVWAMSTLGAMFLELAAILNVSFVETFDHLVLRSFLFQTALGKAFFINFVVAVLVSVLLIFIRKTGGALLILSITFIGFIAPLFQSHSASAGNHGTATGSLIFHVVFISIWVGGVIGLVVIAPAERELSIPRFSALALWSAITVVLSGLINAVVRLNSWSAWKSFYASLVIDKIFLTAILLFAGYKHRQYIQAKLSGSRKVYQLLVGEALLMVLTIAIGGKLSLTSYPAPDAAPTNGAVLSITGMNDPGTPTLSKLLWGYVPDGVFLGLLILATLLYIKGVRVLSKRGDKWSKGRTASWIFGVALADYATSGGVGIYSHFTFGYHMLAHMILGMIAPIFFVLSAPITLALRTLPQSRDGKERGIRGLLLSFMHSRYVMTLSNPIVALMIFDGSLFALYMTPLFGHLMKGHTGHLFMDIHFILAGALFFHVIIGVDPNPKRVPHIVRIIVLFAAMSIHAWFSITVLMATSPLDGDYFKSLQLTWGPDLLGDQRMGGSIGWALGEIPILIALAATFIQWMREDKKETQRIDRASERAAAMGLDDELAEYNRYLAKLNQKDLETND